MTPPDGLTGAFTSKSSDLGQEKPPRLYVSLRLTVEESKRLERDAAGLSKSAYVREKLFGKHVAPRQTRNKFPVKDHKLLSACLARLGQSHLPNNFNQMAKLAHMGALPLSAETEAEIVRACRYVAEIRSAIFTALGLREAER